jgi:hypothetical protein
MPNWIEHNPDTWIIEDQTGHVTALIYFEPSTNLYSVQKHNKSLGLYTNLEAARTAAFPPCIIKKILSSQQVPQKPAKTKQDLPWNN